MIVRQNGKFKKAQLAKGFLEEPKENYDFYVFTQSYPEMEFVADGYYLKKYEVFSKKELKQFYSLKKIETFEKKRF